MDSLWQVGEAFGALGNLDALEVLPPIAGGIAALGSTLLIRKFAKDKPNILKYAPLLGAGAGILLSIPLYYWRGHQAFVSSAVTAGVVGGGLFAFEKVSNTAWAMGMLVPSMSRRPMKGIGMHQVKKVGATHLIEGASAKVPATANAPAGFALEGFGGSV